MVRFTGFASLALAVVVLTSGCGGRAKGPKLIVVKGNVTLDGQPMPEGEITFALPGEVPKTIEIRNGTFSGKAGEGKNRVEIRLYRVGPVPMMGDKPAGEASKENILPPKFNTESSLTADVARGSVEFHFDITSN